VKLGEERDKIAARLQENYAVFISYSHADKEIARSLTDMFDRRGTHYVIDEKELEWTDQIASEVRKRIEQSTHYLLILSDTSAKSQWCAFEYGVATGANKIVCIALTSAEVAVPPFAQPILATANFREVERYFSHDIIAPKAVDRFIAELLGDPDAVLERFEPTRETTEGRRVWISPNRNAIKQRLADRSPWVDYTDSDIWELLQIELGDPASPTPLMLECVKTSGAGSRPVNYVFSYNEAVTAVIVEPPKKGSDSVGVWEETPAGDDVLRDRMPTVEERLSPNVRIAYGWACSRDFWDATVQRLAERLPDDPTTSLRDEAPR